MWDSITVNSVLGPSLPCLGTAYVSEVALLVARVQPLSPDHLYKLSGGIFQHTLQVTTQTRFTQHRTNIHTLQYGYIKRLVAPHTSIYRLGVGMRPVASMTLYLAINMLPAPSAATL